MHGSEVYVGRGVGVVDGACTMHTQQCSLAVPMPPSKADASEQSLS